MSRGLKYLSLSLALSGGLHRPPGNVSVEEERPRVVTDFRFSIFSLGHTKTCQSLQTNNFSPSGRDLSGKGADLTTPGLMVALHVKWLLTCRVDF